MNSIPIEQTEYPKPSENGWLLFIFITAAGTLLTLAGQHLLLSDELYFNALSEQMTFEQIKDLVDQNHEWS